MFNVHCLTLRLSEDRQPSNARFIAIKRPRHTTNMSDLFKDIHFSFAELSPSAEADLKRIVKGAGGVVDYIISKNV